MADSTGGKFCTRCYAHLDPAEAYCSECGAPTGEATPAADSAVHAELAQANLLRLRGSHDEAEKALIGILRKFPNDPHAHEMLGDVCAERDEYDRAIEWYELALDLAPNSPDIRRKLDEYQMRLEARSTADTAESIGLPSAPNNIIWWPLVLSAGLLLLAILVTTWPRKPVVLPAKLTVSAPTTKPEVADSGPAPVDSSPKPVEETPAPAVVTPPAFQVEEDRTVLTALKARPDGSRIESVLKDPRSEALSVTISISESEDPKVAALAAGQAALAVDPNALVVTLRAVRAGHLVFVADLERSKANDTTLADPLTNLWPGTTTPDPTGQP